MFGQPLVNEITNILKAHKEALHDKDKRNKKALVLSLHGWSGVGKNYATNMIAEAIFKNGMESHYVKVFMGKKDFDCSNIYETQVSQMYKSDLVYLHVYPSGLCSAIYIFHKFLNIHEKIKISFVYFIFNINIHKQYKFLFTEELDF